VLKDKNALYNVFKALKAKWYGDRVLDASTSFYKLQSGVFNWCPGSRILYVR